MHQDKIWFVYRTTDKINGMFYVGVHKGYLDDNYLGSGTWLKRVIKNAGRDRFSREIIKVCETADDAYELEELIVDQEFISRYDTYNLALGGRGDVGRLASKSSKERMRKPKSMEHRAAMSAARKGRPTSEAHRSACSRARTGYTHSEETKSRMSKTRSGKSHEIVTCPHCGKTGGAPAMGQWHFDNCKLIGDTK